MLMLYLEFTRFVCTAVKFKLNNLFTISSFDGDSIHCIHWAHSNVVCILNITKQFVAT